MGEKRKKLKDMFLKATDKIVNSRAMERLSNQPVVGKILQNVAPTSSNGNGAALKPSEEPQVQVSEPAVEETTVSAAVEQQVAPADFPSEVSPSPQLELRDEAPSMTVAETDEEQPLEARAPLDVTIPVEEATPAVVASEDVPQEEPEVVAEASSEDAASEDAPAAAAGSADTEDIKEKVIGVLRSIYDPEIPVDIYELGLIYSVEVDAAASVEVEMTLTSPACPVAGSLPPEVEFKIAALDEVDDVSVKVVWEPAWTPDRMSEAAKLELNIW